MPSKSFQVMFRVILSSSCEDLKNSLESATLQPWDMIIFFLERRDQYDKPGGPVGFMEGQARLVLCFFD